MSAEQLKRRMGERDLWDLIVNNDDICFKQILPRMSQTDIKFLYDVNSETRALIKRSPRVDELKKKFLVLQMNSISTLEFAWNNIQWGAQSLAEGPMDQAYFCAEVAHTNKLELLKWAREVKGCEWSEKTIGGAAFLGNLEMVKYCVENQCPMDADACAKAAGGGHLECLKYLHEEAGAAWTSRTAGWASLDGQLHILEYLVDQEYDEYNELSCRMAATEGHLDCLKYLHETAKAPWDGDTVRYAHENNHPECLQYLLDNECPLPEGWWYEDGRLYELLFESP
jgi:hypothetical protein